jgi:anti-sigma regulatory factor (Ser/Thr protein kinase)
VPIQAVLLGMLTIPGDPSQLHEAREFVADAVEYACRDVDTAVLLTSELVTNSLQHSNSRHPGGSVTISVIAVPGGVVIEVIDDGGPTLPALDPGDPEQPQLTETGRGLRLVDTLSTHWSYYSDSAGTVTWFELTKPPRD